MSRIVTAAATGSATGGRRRLSRLPADRLISVAALLALLVVWQGSVSILAVPAFVLPPPTAIGARVLADLTSGEIFVHFRITLVEVLAGFALAAVLGVALGTAVALVRVVDRAVYPFILALQTIPKIAIAPLLIIWFGFGLQSKVIIAALVSFFPILVNVIAGLKTVDTSKILLMRTLKARPWQMFSKVYLPSMLPYLFAGLEVGIIFAVIGAIVGEFIGSSQGLGSLIIQRQANIDVAGVFSVIIYLSAMGTILNGILRICAHRYTFWARTDSAGMSP